MKHRSRYVRVLGLILLATCIATAANATSVRFLDVGAITGFDPLTPGFPTTPDVIMLPDGQSYMAGPEGSGAPVQYLLEHCLLIEGDSSCQPGVPTGTAYTDIVSLTLIQPEPAVMDPPLYLVVGGMLATGYTTSDVWFDTASPSFGENSVDPMLYMLLEGASADYHYFGFLFESYNETKTLRYDVSAMLSSGTPVILTSAYSPVPEPGSACLLVVGLVALAAGRRR